MKVQFTIAGMLRSTAFFALGWWMLIWAWHLSPGGSHLLIWAFFLIPPALAGSLGALLGKPPDGIFLGIWALLIVFLGLMWLMWIAQLVGF